MTKPWSTILLPLLILTSLSPQSLWPLITTYLFVLTVLLLQVKTRTSLPSNQTPVALRSTLTATQTTMRKRMSNLQPTTQHFKPLLAFATVTEPLSTCTNTTSSLPTMTFI